MLAALLCGGAALAFGPPALAQAVPQAADLDEVVVTARRVEEDIQKVPVAVTAIGAEAIKERGIVTTTDVMFAAPSVQMTTTFGRLSGGFSIRGLAGGTQVYFAETPGGPTESAAPFYDIASVQVLNGPQGTLFGRANTAGAVLVEPAKPTFDALYGSAEAAYGNLGLLRATAILNLPVVDDMLAVRLAVHKDHRDGYVHVIGTGERLSEDNSEEGRFSVNFKALDGRLTNYAVLDYYNVHQASSGATVGAINTNLAILNLPVSIDAPDGLAVGTQRFGAVCGQAVAAGLSPDLNACIDQRLRIAATLRPALEAEYARLQAGGHDAIRYTPADTLLDQRETLRKWTFVNQTELDFGKLFDVTTLQVRNIFGYQAARGVTGWDVDGLGGLIQSSVSVSQTSSYAFSVAAQQSGNRPILGTGPYQKVYTNETQVRGVVGDDRLVWSVGGYYQKNPNPVSLGGIRNLSRVNSGVTLATLGYNPSFPFSDGGDTTQKALYGQGTLDISFAAPFIEALHATYGYRKSWDRSEIFTRGVTTDLSTGMYVPTATRTRSFTKSDGSNTTLSLDAQVTPDLLVYGATRKGYRPGGLNLVLNSTGLPNFRPVYDPETVRDYELGAKWDLRLGEARARLNGALYRTEYSNIQRTFSAAVAGVTTTYVVNASAAVIEGAELQGQLVFGDWNISANYAYSDPRFTEWVGADPLAQIRPGDARCVAPSTAAICLIDLTSNPFPNISKHQGSVTAKYTLPLSQDLGEASVQATLYAQSRRYFTDAAQRNIEVFGAAVKDAVSQKAFERINVRADWKHIRGSNWSAGAFVNNLTDVNYKLTTVTQLHSLGTGTVIYAEPRTYGVEVRFEFGGR
ncbi:TonB-dependent receptor [Phenylobacterium sp.]|uniref:TonB-dependent receptor n=1 Tax=Phenylobacterium sp. TaxID=1871053 RepID=UPI0025D53C96|nr:TonB-dependent receptor [Phenylobacterium sp.]